MTSPLSATIFFFIALPNPILKFGPNYFYTISFDVPYFVTKLNIFAYGVPYSAYNSPYFVNTIFVTFFPSS